MTTLFVAATPIGNLSDASERLKTTLAAADLVFAEDTRVAKKLFSAWGITGRRFVSVQAHSTEKELEGAKRALAGADVAVLLTDAGTPGISDPGAYFIDRVYRDLPEVRVVPIPGPSAVITALSVSGFFSDRFLFLGFPPHQKGRNAFFATVAASEETVVFFESVHRIEKTLAALATAVPANRRLCVCRELTKLHESVTRGTVAEVVPRVLAQPRKGEYVLVLEKP